MSNNLDKIQYSSFWLDPKLEAYLTQTNKSSGSNIERILALVSFKRSIANFVRIITNKDIPVFYSSGKDSFATKDSIVISSKIKSNELDVTVGLALHEAMHIVHTNFNRIPKDLFLKQCINLVEDARIDSIAWHAYPGYRGYYKRLYTYYSNELLNRGVLNKIKNNYTPEAYLMYLSIKIYTPNIPKDILPGVDKLLKILDIQNIHKKSFNDVLIISSNLRDAIISLYNEIKDLKRKKEIDAANQIFDKINDNTNNNKLTTPDQPDKIDVNNRDVDNSEDDDDNLDIPDHINSMSEEPSKNAVDDNNDNVLDNSNEEPTSDLLFAESSESIDNNDLDNSLESEINNLDDLKEDSISPFMDILNHIRNGTLMKKHSLDKTTNKNVGEFGSKNVDIESDTFNGVPYHSITITKVTPKEFENYNDNYKEYLKGFINLRPIKTLPYEVQGIAKGRALSSKLKFRDDSKILISSRQKYGRIFPSTLYRVGTGNYDIFYKTQQHSFNPTHIHLTIDASGSMNDNSKFSNAMYTSLIIARACSLLKHIDVTISLRGNCDSLPVNLVLYDSKINTVNSYIKILTLISCRSSTPEGLCFKSLTKYLSTRVNKVSELILINISDGQPVFSTKNINYYTSTGGIEHSRQAWNSMCNTLKAKPLSYFVYGGGTYSKKEYSAFKNIYGKQAVLLNVNNLQIIVDTLNDLLVQNYTITNH